MNDKNNTEEIQRVFQDAPADRQALLDNYSNLHKVAEYCESNYLQGEDQAKALEETKAFTTQSLASVAYQISTLATRVLRLLDLQTDQMTRMESSVNLVAQMVDMHREKVARREIGAFTTARKMPRIQKTIPPASQEPGGRYIRNLITYTELDSIGHGVKSMSQQLGKTDTLNMKPSPDSSEAQGTLGRSSRAPEPVQCPVVPSVSRGLSVSSLNERSTGSSFGIAVPPPTVPAFSVSDIPPPVLEEYPLPPPLDIPPPPPPAPAIPSVPAAALDPPPPPAFLIGENGFPPPMMSDLLPPPPMADGLPAPLPSNRLSSASSLQCFQLHCKRLRVQRYSTISRQARLGRLGLSLRSLHVQGHSLSLSSLHTLIIPPPPPYRPALAPLLPQINLTELSSRFQQIEVGFQASYPPPEMYNEFDDCSPPPPPPADFDDGAPPNYVEKVVALYAYSTDKADELSFEAGEIIFVTKKNADGWYEGVLNGVEGFFPENYVGPAH
ncbi:ABI gene family member 3-like isoform X1 [Acipenser ruthenus]|uniref:ABI gene family member 3-like isoform X1 n=1 Tax=Acipenser ruthenus TaxID=7906 RepID=UPI00145A094A|nr:ABI gene family member 3-like isoform X1 [Acipenser ruthenus]